MVDQRKEGTNERRNEGGRKEEEKIRQGDSWGLHSSGGGDAAYAKAQSMLWLENFATFQQSPLFRILHHLLQPIPILAIYPLLPAFSKIVVCSVSFSSWSTVFHFINEKTGGKRSLVTCSN